MLRGAAVQGNNMPKLVSLSNSLLQHETLTSTEIRQVLSAVPAPSALATP